MTEWKRREILQVIAKSGVCFPALPSLLNSAQARAATAKRRFIVVFTASGQYADHWYPSSQVPLNDLQGVRGLNLNDYGDPVSQIFDATFNLYKDRINLFRGLDMIPVVGVRDHWSSKLLNAWGRQNEQFETIDQIIARSSAFYPSRPSLPSVHFLIKGNSELPESYLSYRKSGNQILPSVPVSSIRGAVNQIFSNALISRKIFALLDGDYRNILRREVLSAADTVRVEAHLDSLSAFVKKSDDLESTVCPHQVKVPDILSERNLAETFVDLIVAGIKCDVSRIFLFNLTECADAKFYSFIPKGAEHFHNLTHMTEVPGVTDYLLKIQKFHASIVLKLLTDLDSVEDEESGETYLDRSLVLWGSSQSVKYNSLTRSANVHTSEDLPVFLAGGAGGRVKTGRYLDYRIPGVKKKYPNLPAGSNSRPPLSLCQGDSCEFDENYPGIGRPLSELLMGIMMAMGLSFHDWESGGEPGFGDYSQNVGMQYDVGDKRTPLRNFLR